MKKFLAFLTILLFIQMSLTAQKDSTQKKSLKNTVRFNITNPIFYKGKSIVFGYERVLKRNQSFSINFGTTSFPSMKVRNSDSVTVQSSADRLGYNASVDYRFYLKNENKYEAPRGVYIGPWYSFNYFDRKNSMDIKTITGATAQAKSDLSMTINSFGAELGYQFIFWRRLAVDLVLIGPGIATYKLKVKVDSNLSDADKTKIYEKLNDALKDKFPGFGTIFKDGEFEKRGSTNVTSIGFRYMIHIGFRF